MQSWSRPSRESSAPPPIGPAAGSGQEAELTEMRKRFVEALRRAEIVSLLQAAESEEELGRLLSEELCEVYEAEIGLVAHRPGPGEWNAVGVVGVGAGAVDRLLASPLLEEAAAAERPLESGGENLLDVGASSALLAAAGDSPERRVVVGVGRNYESEFSPPEVALLETVALSSALALERLWAKRERTELISQLKKSLVGTAEALANALEAKDNYTADHASEVADLAVATGRRLGLDQAAQEELRYGAIFHDIGKIAIPDAILHKPGPLDEKEWEVMKRHPEVGADIVAPIPFISDEIRAMVRHDHENFDGSGYPDGLSGDEIPIGARIILVVDSYHAMTSDRPYRAAMSRDDAIAELRRCAGGQFDPEIVEAFIAVLG